EAAPSEARTPSSAAARDPTISAGEDPSMSRITRSLVLPLLLAAAHLAACGKKDPEAQNPPNQQPDTEAAGDTQAGGLPAAIGEGEGSLDILAWPGYIERGATDAKYDWVTPFEQKT